MPFPDQTASTLAAPSPRSAPLDPSGFDVGQFRDMADSLGNLTFAPQAPDAPSNDVPRFQAPADNLYTIDPSQFTGLADTIQKQYGISNDDVTQHLSDSGFTPEQIKAMPQEHFNAHRDKLAEYGPSSTRKLQELFNEQKQSLPALARHFPISGVRDADAAELEQLRAEVNQRIERNGTLYDPKFVGKFGRIEQLKTRMKSKYPALTKTPAFKAFDAETNKWFVKTQQRQQKVDQNEIKTLREQNPTLLAGNELGGIAQGVLGGGVQLASPAMRFMGQGEEADRILQKSKALQAAQQANVKANGYGYVRGTLNEVLPGVSQSFTEAAALGPMGRLAKTAKGAYALGSAMMAAGFGITTANDAYSEGKQAGLSTKEAAKYAAFQGGLEAGVMLIFQGLGSKIAGLEGVERFLLPAGKELSKQTGKQTLWLMAKGLIGENLEENTTTILQQLNTAATLPGAEDSANWTDPKKEGFASVWESPMMQAIRQTTAQTMLMMGMAETASGAAKLLRSRAKTFAADPSVRNYEKAVEAGLPPNETPPNRAERADMADALHHMIDGLKHPYSADKSQQPGEEVIPPSATEGEAAKATPPSGPVVPNLTSESAITPSGETNATQNQEAQQVPEVRQDKLQVQVPLLSQNDNAGAVENVSDPELTAPAESPESLPKVSKKSLTFAEEFPAQPAVATGGKADAGGKQAAIVAANARLAVPHGVGKTTKEQFEFVDSLPEGTVINATMPDRGGTSHERVVIGKKKVYPGSGTESFELVPEEFNDETGVWEPNYPGLTIIEKRKDGTYRGELPTVMRHDTYRDVADESIHPFVPVASLPLPAVATGGTVASPAQDSPPASGEASAKDFSVDSLKEAFNLSDEQAAATDALAQSIGLDTSKIKVAKGGTAGEGALFQDNKTLDFKDNILESLKSWQNKGTPEQLKAHLAKSKGTKDQADWIGLDEFLSGKPSVTKADVEAFVKANQVTVQEVLNTDDRRDNTSIRIDYQPSLDQVRLATDNTDPDSYIPSIQVRFDDSGRVTWINQDQLHDAAADLGIDPSDLETAIHERRDYATGTGANKTRYGKYVTPGGENYRELLLTLPQRPHPSPPIEGVSVKALPNNFWIVTTQAGQQVGPRYESAEDAQSAASRYQERTLPSQRVGVDFESQHFIEPNVLVHVRFNDRTSSDGKKTLFVEEIQSDWHQAGRKRGYLGVAPLDQFETIKKDAAEGRIDPMAALQQMANAPPTKKVPNAPFKQSWSTLAFKRMIQWASENGYDQIAWATGEQQNERYDLSKQVDYIDYVREGQDKFRLGIVGKNGQAIDLPKETFNAAELEDYVGKDVAQRIVNGEGEPGGGRMTLRGPNLKVGGNGMKGFYDKILPADVNKYVKQWGAKVGTTEIDTTKQTDYRAIIVDGQGRQIRFFTEDNGMQLAEEWVASHRDSHPNSTIITEMTAKTVHAVPITPAMRDTVTTKGQMLFQDKKGSAEFTEDGKALLRGLESPDISTAVHEIAHVARRTILNRSVPAENRAGITDADITVAEKWSGAEDGNWTREAEEKFARGFEKHLRSGRFITGPMGEVFAKLAKWLKGIYKTIKGSPIDVKISEAMQEVFDKLLTRNKNVSVASGKSELETRFEELTKKHGAEEALRIIAAGSKQPETPTVAEKIDEPRSSGAKPSILDRMKQKTEKANAEAIPSKVGKAKASGVDSKAKETQLESVPQTDATQTGASNPELRSSETKARRERSAEQAQRIASLPNEVDRIEATGLLGAIQAGHDRLDATVSANALPEEQESRKNIAKFLKEAESRLEELLSDEGPVETKGQKTARSKVTAEKKKVVRRKITSTAEQKAALKALIDELPADQLLKDLSRGARAGASSAKGYLTDEQADDAGQEAVARAMEIANEFLEQSPRKPLTPWLVGLAKTAGMHKVSESSRNHEIQAEEGSLENVPVRGTSRNASIDASSASNPAPTNVNTSGAATPINRPTPAAQPTPATQQVIARRIPMPELVEMVTHLIGHVPMVGHRLRKALGVAKLSEGTMDAEILLRPDIAKDPKQLARTLAHEIGHLIDWFPNFTMKRGNILGRIGVLRNYLKSMLDALPTNPSRALTPQARRVIRMAAEQSAGPRPAVTDTAATQAWRDAVADEYQRIIQDYVTRNDMLTKEAMKEELIGLSEWWKPYDHSAVDPSYVQYRESSRELYADALSVLLSAPAELSQRAPTFWRSWLGYLDQKPEVSEKIIELWDRLGGTSQEIAARRTERRKEGFVKGSEAYVSALQARIDAEQSTWMKAKSIILQGLLDKHAPINAIAADIGDTNAIHIIDELNQVNNDLYLFFKDTDDNIVKPMLDEGFTPEEIWDEIGEYLIDNRIIKEVSGTPKMDKHGNPIAGTEAKARWEIMNPHGFTRTESIEQMTEQVRRLGKHKFNVLRDRMKAWHRDILWPHIAEAGNVGVYSQDKVTNDLAKNKDAYAAFAVVRYIDEHVSPMLKQQVGTFEDVGNPFHFTMLKFMSLIRLNQLNKAANVVIDDLLPSVNGVTKLDVAYGHTKPAGKPEPGNAWITRLVDGKVEWYEVPANVAAAFDSHDVGMISDIANAMSGPMYSVFHPLYVVFSPGFVTANPFRDMSRTYKNLGATYGVTAREVLTEYLKAIPAAIQHARGHEIAQVHEMLKDKAWGIPWHSLTESQLKVVPMGLDVSRNWSDKLMDSKEWYNKYNPLLQFFKAVRFVGQVEEAAGKISAYNLLGNKGVTGKQRAYDVRKITSTPDWTQSGLLTKFTNLVWMYSRIGFNALQTSAQLATNNYPGHKNTAAGWWWRSAVMTALPVLITKAIMMVNPDDEEYPEELRALSRLLRRIPAYFRENYLSVPFGERTNSEGVKETIFMSVPLNPEDAFLAKITGALFDAMHIVAGGKPRETRSIRQAAGKVASGVADLAAPNLSPPINTGITWLDYLTGKTPKDRFRDTPVIPKRTPEGWESDKKMIQWTINQFGVIAQLAAPATNAMFGEEFSDRKMSTGEAIVDGALKASGAGRIFRHSGRGQDEADWVDFERESQQRKELRAAYVPPAINRINSELSRLRGIPAAELSPTQMQRREQLSIFDSAVVQPLSEGAAKKSPEQLSALKATLNSATAIAGSLSNPNNPLRMPSPPPEIAPLVNDFKYRLVMAATGQVSTEDKIKNKTVVKGDDGKTHTEWLKQYEKEGGDKRDPNIIAARELLKEIAPTADERRELFRNAYRDKRGHFPSDLSPVRKLNDYYDKPAK